MSEPKTKATTASVTAYLDAIQDPARRRDCKALAAMMRRVTGCAPKMWGTSIVGFDSYHYRYDSGREGDSALVAFSNRKGDISVYLLAGYEDAATKALLAKLGRFKVGKACMYLRCLADVDVDVLEQLVARSAAETRRRYPQR